MKVEIDFEEALDEFVKDQRRNYYGGPSAQDIKNYCDKLLGILSSYEEKAQVIFDILEDSPTLLDYVKDKIEESEKDEENDAS